MQVLSRRILTSNPLEREASAKMRAMGRRFHHYLYAVHEAQEQLLRTQQISGCVLSVAKKVVTSDDIGVTVTSPLPHPLTFL